jgi:hypothetical protein
VFHLLPRWLLRHHMLAGILMEPVEIYTEVRRGKEVLVTLKCLPNGYAVWNAERNPTWWIATPDGGFLTSVSVTPIYEKDPVW